MKGFRYLALACLFGTAATPLVISVDFVFPFIEPKAILFRTLVEVALAAWLAISIAGRQYPLRYSPIWVAFIGVVGALLVADSLSLQPWLAFLSRPERMEGFVGFLALLAFIVVGSAMLDSEWLRRVFISIQLLASAGVSLIGVASFITYAVAGHPQSQVFSTLGNPVFLGQYSALMCCLALFMFVRAGRYARWFFSAVAALNFFAIYLSQSRGAAIAMAVAAVVVVLTAADRRTKIELALWGAGAGIILILLPATVYDLPRVRRFSEINFSDPRFKVWHLALKAVWQHPLFGWGQDGLLLAGGYIFPADRAHNLVLDWLVTGGLSGFAAWGVFLWAICRGATAAYQGGERIALYAFLTVYVVTDMFLFDTIGTYLALGTVAVMVSSKWGAQVPQVSGLWRAKLWTRRRHHGRTLVY